jgi:hypothetical protein
MPCACERQGLPQAEDAGTEDGKGARSFGLVAAIQGANLKLAPAVWPNALLPLLQSRGDAAKP